MTAHCEMKGFLSFLVLRMISEKEMSGDDVRKEIEKRKGCLPSAGTIYPVLKDLKEGGLIKELKDGGKVKKYTVTEAGKKEMKTAVKKFVALFSDLRNEF
jgi:PadR family transcriptional regulator PadR